MPDTYRYVSLVYIIESASPFPPDLDSRMDRLVWRIRPARLQFVRMGRVAIQQGCVSRLPFSDRLFDRVTAVHTHNAWPRDRQEILRVLKPGARVILIGGMDHGGKRVQYR